MTSTTPGMKYCLVPVAVTGCGKTTIGIALSQLTGWGNFQSDDIGSKDTKTKNNLLIKRCAEGLETQDCVFLDRNNHTTRLRQQAITDLRKHHANVKFICINFLQYEAMDKDNKRELREFVRPRITSRGDNHQTIQKDSNVAMIVNMMISKVELVDQDQDPDSQFDRVINVDPQQGSRAGLEKVITELQTNYPDLLLPGGYTKHQLDAAIETGLAYIPDKPEQPAKKKQRKA